MCGSADERHEVWFLHEESALALFTFVLDVNILITQISVLLCCSVVTFVRQDVVDALRTQWDVASIQIVFRIMDGKHCCCRGTRFLVEHNDMRLRLLH